MIMHHQNLDWNKHFAFEQGSYVQANQDNNPTNTLRPRTIDCIYLDYDHASTDGGHILMDLATGREIRRSQVKECVMTPLVIKRVEQLAANQGIKTLRFLDRKNKEIIFDDSDLAGVSDYRLDEIIDPNFC